MGFFITGAAMGGRLASLDIISLVLEAGLIVKLVLLLLVVFSVGSWAIIVVKSRELSRAMQDSEAFLEVYHEDTFGAAYEAARQLDRSPLAAIFLAGCTELNRSPVRSGPGMTADADERRLRSVQKKLIWASEREAQRLERGLPFLATTASSAPFIGLFGTVIGIIQAFQSIAESGSASLAVVAPGIAEALIATAVGLLAAIPATIFYNNFVSRVASIDSSIEIFREEFENDLDEIAPASARALPTLPPGARASG